MALTKEQLLRQVIAREESLFAKLLHKHNKSQSLLVALKAEVAALKSTNN